MDVFKYSTKIQRPQAFKTNSKGLLPECSVSTRDPEQRRLKLKDRSIWFMNPDHDRQGRLFTDDRNTRKMLNHPGESLSE